MVVLEDRGGRGRGEKGDGFIRGIGRDVTHTQTHTLTHSQTQT